MAAFRALLAMERSRAAHCDDMLHAPAMEVLSAADRNLATALVMGVLRWQLALDAVIAPYLTRATPLDDAVAVTLRMGALQLLLLDRIPAHAALSESVELTRAGGHGFASGLVNAVLRRISEAAAHTKLDARAAHPAWLLERWTARYGSDVVGTMTAYHQQPPPVTVRADAATAPTLPPASLLTRARRLPAEGEAPKGIRIQDEGSQLVAELAGKGDASGTRGGFRILDCCAAPGGKTAILAENHPRAEITACDISQSRLDAMRRNFGRQPQTTGIHCLLADATALPFRDDFHLILCDAPCSGTGTLARNPEIKLRLVPGELARQQQRQLAILRSAWRLLAPGGRLIYSTCSLEPEENTEVLQTFVAGEPTAGLLDVGARLTEMVAEGTLMPAGAEMLQATAVHQGWLQTLPGVLPCDGFFVALLTRT
jgi:16S rRNA (cytosine967-C5)-methyltransferase